MNLSTEDSSPTNHIAIIFDCLYRFLKYGSSAQVRYVGGFFAVFVPSGLPAVLCGEWQAHEGRAQWREISFLSFKDAQHQNPSSVSRRRDERSETLLDDGVERRVVRRKCHPRLTWISCVAFSPGGVSAQTMTSSSGCELLAGSGFGDEVPGPELRDANDTGVAAPA
jgi:hypothetical protein